MPAPTSTSLAAVVTTSRRVSGTSSRTEKRDLLAEALVGAAPDDVAATVGLLTGQPLQGRIGIGWRTLQAAAVPPAAEASLTVAEVDAALTALAGTAGPGSVARRHGLLGNLLGRATEEEAGFLVRLLGGELRQGALAGVMTDAIARAAEVPLVLVRRAAMLGGDLPSIAALALTGGAAALEGVHLEVGRPVQPMLASTAASVTDALVGLSDVVVDWKLDGIRVQVHRDGDHVRIWTRNLNEVTGRLPEVVAAVRSMPAERLILDGEALVVDGDLRPVLFQDTASRVSAEDPRALLAATGAAAEVRPWFFDLLHRDGLDLVDAPLHERRGALAEVTGEWTIPGLRTGDAGAAAGVLEAALAAGHEGVVVKEAASPYAAGRRGKAWRKVKPVHTLDLVVLAAEWGHGRRTGWLSNLHLGARADGDDEGFVMVGKTFKGLTDDLLRWQTDALRALSSGVSHIEGPHVVVVDPALVVEVAVDGVQRSTRYPGGIALRFARVVRYRPDKSPADADSISAVRSLHPG